ncbi:MAG: SDR family NAD(P)-dependent oxidoreductase [Candidatus Binataceae bacterium]
MGRLDGKIALITGIGGGQGRAAAILFAREGARVIGCDLKTEGAAETLQTVRGAGGEMVSMAPVDLSTEAGAADWVRNAVAAFGAMDILYNNASLPRIGPFETASADDWYFTIRNELDIIHFVTQAAWRHLIDRGGGSIINTASIAALRAMTFLPQTAHSAAKGGVVALTLQYAGAGAPHRIRANAISPGLIASPATEQFLADPDSGFARKARANPLGRIGYPEDVAKLALFLASDDSSYISGVNIVIDGGQSIVL